MRKTTLIAAALAALGIVSQAGAQTTNFVYITGSTAFRGNVFTALDIGQDSNPNAIFDHTPTLKPSTATGSSGQVVFIGTIGGSNYTIDCSWTGSEAGIADVSGVSSVFDAEVPPIGGTNYNLPGIPTTFLNPVSGAAGSGPTRPDLSFADTSQAVSLTPKASFPLIDYGCVGIVDFTWLKGKNSIPDSSWNHLTNLSQAQIYYALGSQVTASFLTGSNGDNDLVYVVGRNRGSGTHVNTFLKAEYLGVNFVASQWAFNAGYQGGVLTYITNGQPTAYPNVTIGAPLGLISIGNDGWDSGGFVSDDLSCDIHGLANTLIIGYAGINDAVHCRDGTGSKDGSTTGNQPGGAVWLTLDGFAMNDGNVVNGAYSYWGHEHLLGQQGQSPTSAAGYIASLLQTEVGLVGGLGTGSSPSAQDNGLQVTAMNVGTPGNDDSADGTGSDVGYPSQF